jgi:hypothetical protein
VRRPPQRQRLFFGVGTVRLTGTGRAAVDR